jgi:hypothetical protein
MARRLERPWWKPIWEFATHILAGTLIFVLLATPAVGLHLLTDFLYSRKWASDYIIYGLSFVEYLIFTADLLLCVIFIFRATARAGRKMIVDDKS